MKRLNRKKLALLALGALLLNTALVAGHFTVILPFADGWLKSAGIALMLGAFLWTAVDRANHPKASG